MGRRRIFRNWKIIFLFLLLMQINALSQKYPLSVEYSKALKNKTRDTSGLPGAIYFVNSADYKIKANFDPETGNLSGSETIIYFNNSADTLKQIVFRLYYNILKKGNARDFSIDPRDANNGVDITKLKIGKYQYQSDDFKFVGTNLIIDKKNRNIASVANRNYSRME